MVFYVSHIVGNIISTTVWYTDVTVFVEDKTNKVVDYYPGNNNNISIIIVDRYLGDDGLIFFNLPVPIW